MGRVDARDVLDPNARTRRGFSAEIIGHYTPTGPNAWDDYRYVPGDEGVVEVHPKIKVMLEERGARFRMRREGRVVRLRWLPTDEEQAALGSPTPARRRALFTERYLELFDEAPGHGPGAFIASKLRR